MIEDNRKIEPYIDPPTAYFILPACLIAIISVILMASDLWIWAWILLGAISLWALIDLIRVFSWDAEMRRRGYFK